MDDDRLVWSALEHLASLDELSIAVVMLRHFGVRGDRMVWGLTEDEVAARLGIHRSKVRRVYASAIGLLRGSLQAEAC